MDEFFEYYKDGMDSLIIPDFSIQELKDVRQHEKYAKRRKLECVITTVVISLALSVATPAIGYAAYVAHKKLHFTLHGFRVDSSNQSQSDAVVHKYAYNGTELSDEGIDKIPTYIQEDLSTDVTDVQEYTKVSSFDKWEDALELIDFPIAYPKNIQYSELKIVYQSDASFKLVEASYIVDEKELTINYTHFLSEGWDLSSDYNAEIVNQYTYKNKYGYEFGVMECQYEDVNKIIAVAYIKDDVIQLSFSGCDDSAVYEILDEFNLSVYFIS